MEEQNLEEWKAFHEKTREFIVFLLLFLIIYFVSYCFILTLRKRKNDLFSGTYEDAVAYRTSLWISAFSLTISISAAFLHPISIVANEVLLAYPNSYYVQWLNSSLIQGLWSLVFLFSNIALFLLLPFAHLFVESEGFPGSTRGVMARVYEVLLVLGLMGLLLMGLSYIISMLIDDGHYSISSIFNFSTYYLPFMYSCMSFFGVLMLLLCTPVGFARLFTVMSDVIVHSKVSSMNNFNNYEAHQSNSEEDDLVIKGSTKFNKPYKRKEAKLILMNSDEESRELVRDTERLITLLQLEAEFPNRKRFKRNFIYPFVMLCLVFLTALSVLMVVQNSLELCFGIKSLPVYSQDITLGLNSLSSMGLIGSSLEIILILYLWCASIVGLYSLPFFHYLRPRINETSMTQIMGNCAVLLVLSSALPVLARSLGITNFDLLGDFGRINWLGNFYIVLFHNIVFSVTTMLCLGTKITASVRKEIYNRIRKLCPTFYPKQRQTF